MNTTPETPPPDSLGSPSGSPLVWREVQREPLIYEAEPVPHHCYLLVSHKGLWAMSKMTGQAIKHGSTLSPRPESMEAALTRAHADWANTDSATTS